MSEAEQSEIVLHGISADVMEVLLDFVYTETVNVSVGNVQELLPAACLLQLTGTYFLLAWFFMLSRSIIWFPLHLALIQLCPFLHII